MDIIKNDFQPQFIVKASSRNNIRHKRDKKRTFRLKRELLPKAFDYYSSKLTKFRPKEKQATALCPFHEERNPSFSINLQTGAFLCFACGASGGGIIDFHMRKFGVNFKQACQSLGVWDE